MTIKRTIDLELEWLEAAGWFAHASESDQAAFLNHVGRVFGSWGAARRDQQMCNIKYGGLNENGGEFLTQLAAWYQDDPR